MLRDRGAWRSVVCGSQRARQNLATEQQHQQSEHPATESWPLWVTSRGFLDSCSLGGFSMGTGHGQNVKGRAFQGWGVSPPSSHPAGWSQVSRLPGSRPHAAPTEWPVCSATPRVCSLPPLCCSSGLGLVPWGRCLWGPGGSLHALQTLPSAPRGWGWCPEVTASGVLVAPYTLYNLSPKVLIWTWNLFPAGQCPEPHANSSC